MQEEYLILQLKKLQNTKANKSLQSKIYARVTDLSEKPSNFYFPLMAFRGSLVAAVLLFFVLIGSGIVLANNLSIPGKPLYPIRKAVETVVPQIIPVKKIAPVVAPQITTSPSITPAPTSTPTVTPESQNGKKHSVVQGELDDHEDSSRESFQKEIEKEQEHVSIPNVENVHLPEKINNHPDDFEGIDN